MEDSGTESDDEMDEDLADKKGKRRLRRAFSELTRDAYCADEMSRMIAKYLKWLSLRVGERGH